MCKEYKPIDYDLFRRLAPALKNAIPEFDIISTTDGNSLGHNYLTYIAELQGKPVIATGILHIDRIDNLIAKDINSIPVALKNALTKNVMSRSEFLRLIAEHHSTIENISFDIPDYDLRGHIVTVLSILIDMNGRTLVQQAVVGLDDRTLEETYQSYLESTNNDILGKA